MRRFRRKVFYVFIFSVNVDTRRMIARRFRNGEIRIPGISHYETRIRSKKSLEGLKREVKTAIRFRILIDANMPEGERRNLDRALGGVFDNETVLLIPVNLSRQEGALYAF